MFIDLLRHFCPGTGTTKLYAKRAFPESRSESVYERLRPVQSTKTTPPESFSIAGSTSQFPFPWPSARVRVCVCVRAYCFLQQIMKCTLFTIAKLNRKIQWGQRATAAHWMLAFGMWCIIHYTDDNILLVTRSRNRMQYGTKAPFPYYGNGKCFTLHW